MARRPPTPPQSRQLGPDEQRTAVTRLESRIKDIELLDVSKIQSGEDPDLQAVEARTRSTLASIFGEGSREYDRLINAADLDATVYFMRFDGQVTPPQQIREGVQRGIHRAVALLRGEVDSLREALEFSAAAPSAPASIAPVANDEVFVVHGHAVVILTPDEVGGVDKDSLRPRARQNVIGEMFWFAGRLGRERVCALVKGNIEMPSDFAGVVYTQMDDGGAWKTKLLQELAVAGYKNLDWQRALA